MLFMYSLIKKGWGGGGQKTVGFLAALLLLILTPSITSAQVTDRRAELIQQIEFLQQEIKRLQLRLQEQQRSLSRLYETEFYDGPLRAAYEIEDGELAIRAGISSGVDQVLFELLQDIVGEREVDRHFEEFRVFSTFGDQLGFVELKDGTNDWILGINTAHYDFSVGIERLYRDLFIHEYAHVLSYENSEVVDEFAARFWSGEDYRHSSRVESSSEARAIALREDYFFDNQDRFVGDYATVNPEEDFAETFVEYVLSDIVPLGGSVVDQKVRYLDFFDELRQVRKDIRQNLEL